MFINYGTQEVVRTVTLDVVKSFNLSMTLPVQEVRNIVEANFNHSMVTSVGAEPTYAYAGFNKITAIKQVRELLSAPYQTIGLREAKEMVEAVWEEGIASGNYLHSRPASWASTETLDDTLPF